VRVVDAATALVRLAGAKWRSKGSDGDVWETWPAILMAGRDSLGLGCSGGIGLSRRGCAVGQAVGHADHRDVHRWAAERVKPDAVRRTHLVSPTRDG